MHHDDRYITAIDGHPLHIDRGERRERTFDADPGERGKQLIIDRQVDARAIVALADDHEARTAMAREIIGERADRFPHAIGQRLLAFDPVALVAAYQGCDLLVGHPSTL